MSEATGRATAARPALREIAAVFLKLGTTAFGGPAAHIAMMEDEVVVRRRWLSHEEFLDYLGATNLIPGPNSTELAIHVGHAQGGWPGLLVAGSCFILPAALIVGLLARAYVTWGALPAASGLLYGVKPVVIAVVAQALWRLGRVAVKSPGLATLTAACIAASAAGVNELAVLAGAGVVWAALGRRRPPGTSGTAVVVGGAAGAGGVAAGATVTAAAGAVGLAPLFLAFAKIGAVLFGSGYVLLAFLRADFVQHLGWLTERQLLDAVAVGQVTPGPVFTTATFIGYLLRGAPGAVAATAGIFLPAFVFVALSGPLVPRLRRSPTAAAVLDGVNAASLALMAVVTWVLGRTAFVDWPSGALGVVALFLLVSRRMNSAWLVLGAGAVGLLVHG